MKGHLAMDERDILWIKRKSSNRKVTKIFQKQTSWSTEPDTSGFSSQKFHYYASFYCFMFCSIVFRKVRNGGFNGG